MASLELRGISKTFRGGLKAVHEVDLTVASGELFVIVGPSGSGKSTLLRLIAGLESLDAGSIYLGGRRVDGLPPRARDLAMVFQESVVYPHLDVFGNIAFGLKARRVDRGEIERRVAATAGLLGLGALLRRSPTTLSGGQKRRVTLARALVLEPGLILLDEPFTGLDAPLRASIRAEIADLHRRTGSTMVLVTHDQAEALALADRIAVMREGRVLQVGRPLDLLDAPAHQFVARFLGQPAMALVVCKIVDDGLGTIQLEPSGAISASWPVDRQGPAGLILADRQGFMVHAGLRAEGVAIAPARSDLGQIPPGWVHEIATVVRLELTGAESVATLRLGPCELSAWIPGRSPIRVGDEVAVALGLDLACWFDPTTGDRLSGPARSEVRED